MENGPQERDIGKKIEVGKRLGKMQGVEKYSVEE